MTTARVLVEAGHVFTALECVVEAGDVAGCDRRVRFDVAEDGRPHGHPKALRLGDRLLRVAGCGGEALVGAVDQNDRRSCVLDVLRLRARQVRIPYEIPADELRKSPEDGLGVAEVVVLLDAVRSVDAP